MAVRQISVFLENKIGRLAEITQILGNKEINIRALAIADTTEFGILRMIVDRPQKAYEALEERGFTVSQTEVVVVEVEDKPGGLAQVMAILGKEGINVEYLYAFVAPRGRGALVVLKIEEKKATVDLLQEKKVKILSAEEISRL
ncbi:amino acid-binding protein [Candidatus Aerophobetes bacterium Ae_b3b]|nr:MAG: amino acid-binding protein [Candidatus Aerophobetes bacterium Ae_b3b]